MGFPWLEMYPEFLKRRDKWAEFRQVIYDSRFKFQDDLEAQDWMEEVRVNPELQHGLIQDHQPHDITSIFINEMLARRCAPKRNFVLVLVGPPGAGKTIMAAILDWEAHKFIPDAEHEVCTSENQMIDSFSRGSEHHKITIFDENLKSTDVGADTIREHVNNFMKELREHEHNLIYEIKYFEHIPFATYYVIMFGYNEGTGETRALVRSQRGHYLGFIILQKEFDDDDPFFEPYRHKKAASFETLQRNRGKIDALDGLDKEQVALDVITFINANKEIFYIKKKVDIVALFDTKAFKEQYPEIIIPMKEIKQDIATQVMIRIQKEKTPKEKGIQKESGGSEEPQDYKILSMSDRPDYLEEIENGLKAEKYTKRGEVPHERVRAFHLKAVSKEGNDDVARLLKAEGLKGSVGSISNWIKDIQTNHLGYVFEKVIDTELIRQDIPHIAGGGNTDDIDEIIFEDVALQIPKEVRSIKCYCNFDLYKAVSEVGDNEKNYAREHHIPCLCYAYEPFTQILRLIELFLPPINQSSIPDENGLSTPPLPAAAPPPALSPPATLGGGGGQSAQEISGLFSGANLIKEYQELQAKNELAADAMSVIENLLVASLSSKILHSQATKEEAGIFLEIITKFESICKSKPDLQRRLEESNFGLLKKFAEMTLDDTGHPDLPPMKRRRRSRR